jgi:uncharacterized protein
LFAHRDAKKPIPACAGIGLRGDHYRQIDDETPGVGWLEVHTENYFGEGGLPHYFLERLGQRYPLSFHGVGLSLGSTDAIDEAHLDRTLELVQNYAPALISEHLSWSSVGGIFTNDLLPLPYTRESLDHFCRKVDHVQMRLNRRILIENPSTYLVFHDQEMSEPEFLNELARRTGCGILLDVNNIHVCASNHGFDARSYINDIDGASVGEIHLAGHVENAFEDGSLLIDSHNRPVCDDVWKLFRYALDRVGPRPTLIEWDTELPELTILIEHADIAQRLLEQARARAA